MTLGTIAIVGVSLAGFRAAEALRGQGYSGRLVLIGQEPHFPPIDRPPMSKQLLSGEYPVERARLSSVTDLGVDTLLLLPDVATGLNLDERQIHLRSGGDVQFDSLLIATGAAARPFPGRGGDLDGVLTLRTIEDSQALHEQLTPPCRLVVIGAGFIGTEIAATAKSLGINVTVVEASAHPLERGGGRIVGEYVRDIHAHHGVDMRLQSFVRSIDGDGRVESVTLDDGTVLPADVVVVAIGSLPNTEWLEDSGLPVDDGIVCGANLLVADTPFIAGAGDVARWYNPLFGCSMRVEHWTNAVEQAAAAATSLLAGPRAAPSHSSVPYVWSDQYGAKLQLIGITTGDFVLLERGPADAPLMVGAFIERDRVVGGVCINRPAAVSKLRRLVLRGGTRSDVEGVTAVPTAIRG
ncbi:NAD(P)/FAD-dependent oxidoreductase [Mycobacterium deserti]|uniref:FAD-dependent oxidoreductase n=1 Tax=Mycobacterium deserti TaxID=2978347 RepID=A0ABT2MHW3_9MYCO|nr:FAD-dependent oxidoreductase [Mycobacterium deserti]MCT7661866.1 FAD-dependent oxidoreductase [Mycobacterium deserti]